MTTMNAHSTTADLRTAADWFDAHPDAPEPHSVHRYKGGVEISFRTDDADEAAVLDRLLGDGYRWRSDYDDDDDYVYIESADVGPRLRVSVTLARAEVDARG